MKISKIIVMICLLILSVPVMPVWGGEDKGFDSEKMIHELEKQIELSHEQWKKLKPVLEEKSRNLKEGINESVDQGFLELDKLMERFDSMSDQAEAKVKDMLSSDEAQRIREYLKNVDKEAIEQIKSDMAADLTQLLDLTAEQAEKIKPALEDSFDRLSKIIDDLANQGSQGWLEFKEQFKQLSNDLYKQLQDTLNKDQLDKFKQYNDEKEEKIHQAVFNV